MTRHFSRVTRYLLYCPKGSNLKINNDLEGGEGRLREGKYEVQEMKKGKAV